MRLLTVSHFFVTHGGGIERVAGHLNTALAAQGHDIRWAAAQEGALPDLCPTRAIGLASVDWLERISGLPMPIPLPSAIIRLWRAVANADAVVVHDALYLSSILAVIASRWHGKPVVLIQHIADIPFSGFLMRAVMALADRLATRPMLRAADQVVFISASVRDRFTGVHFRRPPLLIFNGVATAVFRNAEPGEREVLREAHSLGDTRTLLFVGRFVAKKGLAIIEKLALARPDWRFVLVGRGPIDPERWNLPNVRVVGEQPPAVIAELYRATDLLLLPSVGEGFPLVVQEAMASGLRIVCGADTALADPEAARWLTGVMIDMADPAGTAVRVSAEIDALPAGPPPLAMTEYAARRYSWPGMATAIARAIERISS